MQVCVWAMLLFLVVRKCKNDIHVRFHKTGQVVQQFKWRNTQNCDSTSLLFSFLGRKEGKKIVLKAVRCESANWTEMAHDRVQWQVFNYRNSFTI